MSPQQAAAFQRRFISELVRPPQERMSPQQAAAATNFAATSAFRRKPARSRTRLALTTPRNLHGNPPKSATVGRRMPLIRPSLGGCGDSPPKSATISLTDYGYGGQMRSATKATHYHNPPTPPEETRRRQQLTPTSAFGGKACSLPAGAVDVPSSTSSPHLLGVLAYYQNKFGAVDVSPSTSSPHSESGRAAARRGAARLKPWHGSPQ